MENFKKIHIGRLIKAKIDESNIESLRICNFLKCTETELYKMYQLHSIDTEILLRWSKLLSYDFFRVYTQHMILFSPPSAIGQNRANSNESKLPEFRKNIYSKEVIDFILELIETGTKTKLQIIDEYKIPKTTLYKWISKYKQ